MLNRRSTVALVATALAAALLAGGASAAIAAQITLSPASGTAGTAVSVSGTGFAVRTTGRMTFGTVDVATFTTNLRGGFALGFAVPSGFSGTVDVKATVKTTTVRAPFSVLAAVSPPPPPPPSGIWKPAATTTWQIQLTGTVDQTVDAQMYDIDGFDNSAGVVSSLKAQGRRAVCYFSAGSYEDWRRDAAQVPAAVLGGTNGWPGERWLDIRRIDLLAPIMRARMDMCRAKGFDAVDPDNVDGYANSTGFPLTAADQLAYNGFLADEAHARGMSIGLKNDVDQIAQLAPSYDFAVNEQCFQYSECKTQQPFVAAGKPVFNIEYQGTLSSFCPAARSMGLMSIKKRLDLGAYREKCW